MARVARSARPRCPSSGRVAGMEWRPWLAVMAIVLPIGLMLSHAFSDGGPMTPSSRRCITDSWSGRDSDGAAISFCLGGPLSPAEHHWPAGRGPAGMSLPRCRDELSGLRSRCSRWSCSSARWGQRRSCASKRRFRGALLRCRVSTSGSGWSGSAAGALGDAQLPARVGVPPDAGEPCCFADRADRADGAVPRGIYDARPRCASVAIGDWSRQAGRYRGRLPPALADLARHAVAHREYPDLDIVAPRTYLISALLIAAANSAPPL